MHRIHRHTIHRINYYLLLLDNNRKSIIIENLTPLSSLFPFLYVLHNSHSNNNAELKSLERKARLFFTQPFIDMKIEVILT